MPLKHLTETFLIVLLALLTIATGVAVSTLPPIPEGFFPWAAVFAGTLLYPAAVYPMLKNNRADYAFRGLHFAPAAIAIGWLLLQVATLKVPRVEGISDLYTWGFSAAGVVLTFVLLAVFSLSVIRRRVPRVAALTILLVPFLALAAVNERTTHWDDRIAALVWDQTPELIAQDNGTSSSALSLSSKGEKNLSASSVPEEEAWRAKLRAVEMDKNRSHSSVSSEVKTTTSLTGVKTAAVLIGKKTKLPKSGGETESLALFFVALLAGTVHARARNRIYA